MGLSVQQEKQFSQLLSDTFDIGELQRLLKYNLEVSLEDIVSLNNKKPDITEALLEWTKKQGLTDTLIKAACKERPHHQGMRDFYTEYTSSATSINRAASTSEQNRINIPIFNQQDILTIRELLISAQLVSSNEDIDSLLAFMNADFRTKLSRSNVPSTRVMQILEVLNITGEIADGEIPFKVFLTNAVHLQQFPQNRCSAQPEGSDLDLV
ncbi:MAG: effector-associated domain EAD1-containing protein [Chloroflexota bacterium]